MVKMCTLQQVKKEKTLQTEFTQILKIKCGETQEDDMS